MRLISSRSATVSAVLGTTLMLLSCSGREQAGDSTSHEVHRHNFGIEMEAGHAHIFRPAELTFTVLDLDTCTDPEDTMTCEAVAGLPVIAYWRAHDATQTREQELEPGKLDDNGDGTYTFTRTFGDLGAHMVGLHFMEDGQMYHAAFPMETSRAGGERFFCDSDAEAGDDVAYQIRWNASTGHIHANGEEVSFSIELLRSFNEPINVEQPWQNSFDHLVPELLVGDLSVELMSGEGAAATSVDTLTPTYAGRGIYDVTTTFDATSVGADGGEFWLRVTAEDSLGCVLDTAEDEEEYDFHVSAEH